MLMGYLHIAMTRIAYMISTGFLMYTIELLFEHHFPELLGAVKTGGWPIDSLPRQEVWCRELVSTFIEVAGHLFAVKILYIATKECGNRYYFNNAP